MSFEIIWNLIASYFGNSFLSAIEGSRLHIRDSNMKNKSRKHLKHNVLLIFYDQDY